MYRFHDACVDGQRPATLSRGVCISIYAEIAYVGQCGSVAASVAADIF